MDSIQQKGDSYYCQFCYLGKRHTISMSWFVVSALEMNVIIGWVFSRSWPGDD